MEYKNLAYSDNLSLYALSNAQEKLSKVLVAIIGKWEGHSEGSFEVNTSVIEEMYTNFNNQDIDTVCDYEHQTLTGQTAPASGWIKSLSIEDEKLFAHVDWTDKAKEMIKDKEYKYVSPVYQRGSTDSKTNKKLGWTLHSLSLTNRPFLEELGEVVANSSKVTISLKKANEELKIENIALKNKLSTLNTQRVETIVNKAIEEKKLRPTQRVYALKLATNDLDGFNEFISNNQTISLPPSNIFANSNTSKDSDIKQMVEIASKQKV